MRFGVILATYGEPPRNGFAAQWMYSYRILRGLTRKVAPIPTPLLPIIATSRAITRVKLWKRHQFSSPLEMLHEETVDSLQDVLIHRYGHNIHVIPAYEFRRPSLADALGRLQRLYCDHAIVVPMYIAEGDFTHGLTRLGLDDAMAETGWPTRSLTMCSLAQCPFTEQRLAETIADHMLRSVRKAGIAEPLDRWAVLLAAHGTVVTPRPGVDNGLEHFGRILHRVKALLRPHAGLVRVGWLNHTRGGRWTTPAVPEALDHIRSRGYEKLIYYPWGFTTDNAETALEGRIALQDMANPFPHIHYVECLNGEKAFIDLLADRVLDHLAAFQPRHLESTPLAV